MTRTTGIGCSVLLPLIFQAHEELHQAGSQRVAFGAGRPFDGRPQTRQIACVLGGTSRAADEISLAFPGLQLQAVMAEDVADQPFLQLPLSPTRPLRWVIRSRKVI